MQLYKLITPLVILFLASGCATMKPSDFGNEKTASDPIQFFIGHTISSGVLENRGGKPTSRITTETNAVRKDSIIYLEQDLYPEGGKKNHRSWTLRKIDEHHIDAKANDIDGTAHGLLYGNEFSWTFRLKLSDRKVIRHARMSQHMYLMPDGKTMIIRSVIRKFSFIVAEITEEFRKD